MELNAIDLVTDDLKRKLADCNGKVKEIEYERAVRRKICKETKASPFPTNTTAQGSSSAVSGNAFMSETTSIPVGELEDENFIREKEKKVLEATINPVLKADIGASISGLYELCGNVFDSFPTPPTRD